MKWVRLSPDGLVDLDSDQSQRDDCVPAPDHVRLGWQLDDGQWFDPYAGEKRLDAIKAEASRRITQRFPAWKQLNMTRRHAELQGKLLILPGTALAKEKQRLEADFAWIEAMAAESDRLEADSEAIPAWPE
jgi:hypothetical protein